MNDTTDMPIITRHRPKTFKQLIGNKDVFRSLMRRLKDDKRPHAYLALGPSGTGKTTVARIIASKIGAEVLEIDAASNSGVDAARQLAELGNHMSLSGEGKRLFIIDECHTLSKQAWQALLKLLEEPPSHLYIVLCTTEQGKVPVTIVTRCFPVQLKRVYSSEMRDWLEDVICPAEGWEVAPEVIGKVVAAADGSPRMALTLLDAVYDVDDPEEVERIIRISDDNDPAIQVAKLLLSGKASWNLIKEQLAKLQDNDLDLAIPSIARYISIVMHRAKDERQAERAWQILEALTFPVNSFDARVVFFAFLGRVMWSK